MGLPLVAAGISAVGSLIGGRRAAKEQRRAIAEMNAYNDPSAIRARAEAAGFNPLLFVGPGVGNQTALAQPVMGQAIANAGLALSSGMMDQAEMQAQQSAVMQQNAELRKQLESLTLRPKVPGIYGNGTGTVSVPSVPRGIDETVINAPGTVANGGLTFGPYLAGDVEQGFAPPGEAAGLYPLRKEEVMPVKSLPILADIELPDGNTVAVPHDGDEIMGIEKIPVILGSMFVDHFREDGRKLRVIADKYGITDPNTTYTPGVILDRMLPKRYDPETYTKRNGMTFSFGNVGKRKLATGFEEFGF